MNHPHRPDATTTQALRIEDAIARLAPYLRDDLSADDCERLEADIGALLPDLERDYWALVEPHRESPEVRQECSPVTSNVICLPRWMSDAKCKELANWIAGLEIQEVEDLRRMWERRKR